VLVRSNGDQVWENVFDGGSWSGWMQRSGVLAAGSPQVDLWNGELDVYVLAIDGAVWKDTLGSVWGSFTSMGGNFDADPAALATSGSIDVFARSADGSTSDDLWNGSSWSGWIQVN
jgi:hypothetical protein